MDQENKLQQNTANVIELSGEDILNLAAASGMVPGEELTIEEVAKNMVDYPSAIRMASFFKCFGDASRLRILQALSVRDLCVKELCELLDASQPAVSNHLRVLSQQDMVRPHRKGKNIYYSLNDWHINAIIGVAMERYGLSGMEQL